MSGSYADVDQNSGNGIWFRNPGRINVQSCLI